MNISVNNLTSREERLINHAARQCCPLVQEPLGDCYCFKLGSQDIENAVYYCSKNYKTCNIYKVQLFKYTGVTIEA